MERKTVAILADFPETALSGEASGRGGGQACTWLPQLAQRFEGVEDIRFHWFILDRGGRRRRSFVQWGQEFSYLPAPPFTADLLTNYLPARWILGRALTKTSPDLVHAWGTESTYASALKGLKSPSILSMQGVLSEYARIGVFDGNWRWRRLVASEPESIRSATVVTAESEWGSDKVRNLVPEADCRLVEYGVHPSFFEIKWSPDEENPYLLYIGSAGRRKGFDVLLDALQLLGDRSWTCHLVGDPEMGREIGKRNLPRMECLGLLPWKEMQQQIAGARAVTLPTRADTSPNTVKESRVVGAPVVVSRHGGHTGYVRNGVNGLIVDPLEPEVLASALEDVMSSSARARKLGEGRLAEDREFLSPDRTAERFLNIYRELLRL